MKVKMKKMKMKIEKKNILGGLGIKKN